MDQSDLAHAYRLISELFLHPESRDAALIETEKAWLENAPTALRLPLRAFLAEPAAESVDEYVATLELAPRVPRYLGSHLFEEPQSCRGAGMSGRNGYMLELTNIYRHFGVEFRGNEMSDFVTVVVEFLGISLGRGAADRIGLRRYLVETLLVDAFETLGAALRNYESPYAYLTEALRAALAEDMAQMADGPKWHPPADDVVPPMLTAAGCLATTDRAASEIGPEQ